MIRGGDWEFAFSGSHRSRRDRSRAPLAGKSWGKQSIYAENLIFSKTLRKEKLLKLQGLLGNYFLKGLTSLFFFNSGDQITLLNFTFHNDKRKPQVSARRTHKRLGEQQHRVPCVSGHSQQTKIQNQTKIKRKARKAGRVLWKPGSGSSSLPNKRRKGRHFVRGALVDPVHLEGTSRPWCCRV